MGIEPRPLSLFTNDINASSEFGLDGNVFVRTPNINLFQGEIELPTTIVEADAAVAQICSVNRGVASSSNLSVGGKGGIIPAPDLPLESTNIAIADNSKPTSSSLQPVTTGRGNIEPARGIRVTKREVILTADRANNSDRLPAANNCS